MKNSSEKLVEQFQVGVAASIDNNKSFPLTFLDIPLAGPIYVKRLFFYNFPYSTTNHFYQTTLPYLKRSLSLTLQRFFPLAGNLLCPPPPHKPFIQCTNEDSVAFTLVESSLDFNLLASNSPKSINDLRTLAPKLVGKAMHHDNNGDNVNNDDTLVFPILALKATVFANRGVCIAVNYCHVMDDNSCGQFMKSWSSLCGTIMRSGEEVESTLLENYLSPPPCLDRDVLKDPKGLESIFLSDYFREWQSFKDKVVSQSLRSEEDEDYVKATIVFGRKDIDGMKKFALNQLKKSNKIEAPQYLSSFVVTTAFLWSNLVKTKHRDEDEEDDGKEDCIRFAADVRGRLKYPIAANYFGNCITRCHGRLKRKELKGEEGDGFVNAVMVIEKAINDMKEEPFRDAENWKSTFKKLFVLENSGLLVAGSHKFAVYETDFGFGRPVKVEMVHSFRVMSIADSGDSEGGGIEFGMVFRKGDFQSFLGVVQQGLQVFATS